MLWLLTLCLVASCASGSSSSGSCSNSLGLHFYSWDGQKQCQPSSFATPRTEEEVVEVVKNAAFYGDQVKVVGAGMSFSGVQMSSNSSAGTGTLLSLDRMNKILRITPDSDGAPLVEVQGGIHVRTLCQLLAGHKLALLNLGATATQSIVGATATGTHGTGTEIGGLATQIVALRIVDSKGQVHTASSTDNPTLFNAARTAFGALGIITSVTLQAVPLWKMKRSIFDMPFSSLVNELPSMMQRHPRLQWSWIMYTDNATVLVRDDVAWDTPIDPPGPDGGCWSDSQPTSPQCTDLSYKTLTDSEAHYEARSLYTEMEMFIPAELAMDAVRDFNTWTEQPSVKAQYDPSIAIQGMVRYVAADSITLSPMSGRATAVLSFIASGDQVSADAAQAQFELFSRGLQAVCETAKYLGRPHWGKVSWVAEDGSTPTYLRGAFGAEGWDNFLKMRGEMDSEGLFGNEYLEERMPM